MIQKTVKIEIPNHVKQLHTKYAVSYRWLIQTSVNESNHLVSGTTTLEDLTKNSIVNYQDIVTDKSKSWRQKRDPVNHFKWYKKYYAKNRKKIIAKNNERQKLKRQKSKPPVIASWNLDNCDGIF